VNGIPPLIASITPAVEAAAPPQAQSGTSGPLGPPAFLPAFEATPLQAKPRTSRWTRFPLFFWKLYLGMRACLSLTGGMMALGWSYRLAQRSALKRWWKLAPRGPESKSFGDFARGDDSTRPHLRWPNWVVRPGFFEACRQNSGEKGSTYLWRLLREGTASLRRNFWIGLQGLFNTWVLTLPACVLMAFAWYDGWHNSFNKGYEQAFVGPAVSFVGIFALIGAMYYLPMAQARQAVTGEWKAFYQFRLVWEVIRHRWLSSLGLAALYTLLCLPLTVLKVAPTFLQQAHPQMEFLTDAEVVRMLNRYFFWCGIYIFPAFALLRVVAARVYASALVEGLQRGWFCHESLGSFEARALQRLNLVYPRPEPRRHPVLKIVRWAGTRLGRGVSYTLLFFIWFGLIAQTYIAQFFKFSGSVAWLNQPLIHAPWFRSVPSRIESPLRQLFFLVLLAGGAGLLRSIYLKLKRGRG
jgi:hypothetical protein